MDDLTKQAMREWTLAQPRVSAFVLSVVRDPADRDDVLQETAVAVVESFGSFDQSKPFLKWAMGIARNQVRMYLRRRRRDRLVFDDDTVAAIEGAFVRTVAQQSRRMDFLQDCLELVKGRAKRLCELRYRMILSLLRSRSRWRCRRMR